MRKDMNEILIERPRRGSRNGHEYKGELKAKQRLGEDSPFRESTSRNRRPYGTEKELNENLMPLFRFLLTHVGKNWNKVYQEIRADLNPSNASQFHILQHLDWYVEKNVIEVSKGVFKDSKGLAIGDPFFVNPKTGCLMKNEQDWHFRKHRTWKPKVYFTRIGERTFKEIEGVWYEIGIQKIPDPTATEHVGRTRVFSRYTYHFYHDSLVAYDYTVNHSISRDEARKMYGGHYHATMKRQLNGKEIKRLGLQHSEQPQGKKAA